MQCFQSTINNKCIWYTFGIKTVMVPKNMTHLLQPLDLTTNGSFKNFEKKRSVSIFLTRFFYYKKPSERPTILAKNYGQNCEKRRCR